MSYLYVLLLGGHSLIVTYLVSINVALVVIIIVIKAIAIVVIIIISVDDFVKMHIKHDKTVTVFHNPTEIALDTNRSKI